MLNMTKVPLMTRWTLEKHDVTSIRTHLSPILIMIGSSLAILSYWAPWGFFIYHSMFHGKLLLSLVFIEHFDILYPPGPFISGIVGILTTLSILVIYTKTNTSPYPSLAMLGLLLIPWISLSSIYFLFDDNYGIISTGFCPGDGYLAGFPLNLIAVILLIIGVASALLCNRNREKRPPDISAKLVFGLLNIAVILAMLAALTIWPSYYTRSIIYLPLTVGISIFITTLFTLKLGQNPGLIITLIWTGLEIIWITTPLLQGLNPIWERPNGIPTVYFGTQGFHEPPAIGPILFLYTGFLILLTGIFLITQYEIRYFLNKAKQQKLL